MTFSGHDPSGGAGTQADIEVLSSMGCHAVPVVTALTVQDTHNVIAVEPVAPRLIIEQARAVLADVDIAAFKIGLLGSCEAAQVLHTLLADYPEVPLVFDPITAAGGGKSLASSELVDAMRTLLLPLTTLLTPNVHEARLLAQNADSLEACAQELMSLGCEFVLLTGTHAEDEEAVVNRFYGHRKLLDTSRWPRLAHTYHGSGCTLAAGIAGLLAQGLEPLSAIHEAQQYTWETLNHAYRIGQGQLLPNRLFWAQGGR
jgi:hydroxymethylpyrimidine/phosphomethylpyrimidine kinase